MNLEIPPATAIELYELFCNIVRQKQRKNIETANRNLEKDRNLISDLCESVSGHWQLTELIAQSYASSIQNNGSGDKLLLELLNLPIKNARISSYTRKLHLDRENANASKTLEQYISNLYKNHLPKEAQTALHILSFAGRILFSEDYVKRQIPKGGEALNILHENGWLESDNGTVHVFLPELVIKLILNDDTAAHREELILFTEKFLREIQGTSDMMQSLPSLKEMIYNLHDYILKWLDKSDDNSLKELLEKLHVESIRFMVKVHDLDAAEKLLNSKYDCINIDRDSLLFKSLQIAIHIQDTKYMDSLEELESLICSSDEETFKNLNEKDSYDWAMGLKTVLDTMMYVFSAFHNGIDVMASEIDTSLTIYKGLAYALGQFYSSFIGQGRHNITMFQFNTRNRYMLLCHKMLNMCTVSAEKEYSKLLQDILHPNFENVYLTDKIDCFNLTLDFFAAELLYVEQTNTIINLDTLYLLLNSLDMQYCQLIFFLPSSSETRYFALRNIYQHLFSSDFHYFHS